MPPSYAVPSHYRFSKLFRKEAPDGRGRTFVPDNVSIRIRLTTRRPLLFPSSQTRQPIGSPYGSLACTQTTGQKTDGVPTFHINTTLSNLGSARPPVAQHLRRRTLEPPYLTTYLLVKAYQHLWLLLNDGSAAVHMMVNPIALSWLPTAVDAGRVELASQLALQEPKFFGLHYKTLHTQRSSTPRRMALLDTGGRTPGCVLDFSASFHTNHNKYLCDFVSQLTIKLIGAPFFSASG